MAITKIHYPLTPDLAACGRPITETTRTTTDLSRLGGPEGCQRCYGSPHLDGQLGNMTHTGH